MIRRSESRLHQAPGHESDNVPRRKRYRSVWSHQPTYLYYGIILAALLMLDGVELTDQEQDRINLWGNPIHHPTKFNQTIIRINQDTMESTARTSHGSIETTRAPNQGTTKSTAGTSHGTPRMTGPGQTTEIPTEEIKICTTHDCESIANDTLSMMNTRVDRCDDFYGYACGGFTEIPKGKNKVTAHSVFHDNHEAMLFETVTHMFTNEILPYKVAKNLFDRCMDTNRIEKEGNKTLLDVLDSLGGWPILEGERWNTNSSFSWEQSMKNIRELGYDINYLFNVHVGEDVRNASRRILLVDLPTLGLSRKDFLDDARKKYVESYNNSIVKVAVLLGAEIKYAGREATRMVKFEKELANISVPGTTVYMASVKDFQRQYPRTDWIGYFNAMLGNASIDIDENETIIVRAPSFIDQLFPLLQKTSPRTISNYIKWRAIQYSLPFLSKKFRETVVLGAKQKQKSRTQECVDITYDRFYRVVVTLYAKIYIDDQSMRDALVMADEIRKEFVDILGKIEWMDEAKRQAALDKINSTVFHLDYHDEPANDNKLIEYYEDLEFDPEASYLRTVLNIDKFRKTKMFKGLRQPRKQTVYYLDPSGIRVFRTTAKNSIGFNPHYLRPPFFSHFWPTYMKYGVLGPVIGRMMIRSLVDHGWQFDKTGISAGWCQTATRKAFQDRAFCFLDQHVNRKSTDYRTLAEKMADNGGILIAYKAYKKWTENNGTDVILPDLNLTFDQMFWLSAAQSWCSAYRPKTTDSCIINSAPHLTKFRVLDTMSNMDEFSWDFICPSGSRMNPAQKCKVW